MNVVYICRICFMAMRFYTADFHLGMEGILEYENRPFKDIRQMDRALIDDCNEQA